MKRKIIVFLIMIMMLLAIPVAMSMPQPTVRHVIADAHGPYSGYVGQPVHFFGSGNYGYPPYTWYWTFGDGCTSTQQNPVHYYSEPYTGYVTLKVTDSHGYWDTDTAWATITEAPYELVVDVHSNSHYYSEGDTIPIAGHVGNTGLGDMPAFYYECYITLFGVTVHTCQFPTYHAGLGPGDSFDPVWAWTVDEWGYYVIHLDVTLVNGDSDQDTWWITVSPFKNQ